MNNNKIIEIEDLSRTYKGGKVALKEISLSIVEGEVYGILGPNGAGKSTLIKIMSTILSPTEGKVNILGYDVKQDYKRVRPLINFIFGGERGVYWRLTGRENLEYFSDLYNITREHRNKVIPELLKTVGLENDADKRVEFYSKGMKQRLVIAKGLINDPKIIFLDEPTIGLDPIINQEFRSIIRKLKEEKKTIIFTTHIMQEASEICDRLAIIKNGQIVQQGPTEEIVKNVSIGSTVTIKFSPEYSEKNKHTISETEKRGWTLENINTLTRKTNNVSETISYIYNLIGEKDIFDVEIKKANLEDAYINIVNKEVFE